MWNEQTVGSSDSFQFTMHKFPYNEGIAERREGCIIELFYL